jgi:abortive infection bacteriophage resistance protein
MRYNKPALTFDQQYDLLLDRGLIIQDRLRAQRWLRHISYYRFSAYFVPFKVAHDRFATGTTFDQVAGSYIFDRKLRLILMDAIERLEVALRTGLTYGISHQYGPFGHVDPLNFDARFDHEEFMEELAQAEEQSRESFLTHYRNKYVAEDHLPLWMASELLSFGRLSRVFKNTHPDVKKSFARRLDVPDVKIISSWLHTLNYVRNVCAHHSRLWNREIAVKPILPRASPAWPYQVPGTDRLYQVLVIIRHALVRTWPQCRWRERLFELFDQHPSTDLAAMQIPTDWRTVPPWTGDL